MATWPVAYPFDNRRQINNDMPMPTLLPCLDLLPDYDDASTVRALIAILRIGLGTGGAIRFASCPPGVPGVVTTPDPAPAPGAIPVSSCNAGAFGGRHPASSPHVAFFLPKDLAPEIMRCAEAADVGLLCDESGLAQIYGQGEMDLVRFAQTAWERSAAGEEEAR